MFTLFVEYHPSKLFISIQTFGKMCSVYNTLIKVSHVFLYIFLLSFSIFFLVFSPFFVLSFFPWRLRAQLYMMSAVRRGNYTWCQDLQQRDVSSSGTAEAKVWGQQQPWFTITSVGGYHCYSYILAKIANTSAEISGLGLEIYMVNLT